MHLLTVYRVANAEYFPLLAGQGLRMLKKGQSAAEIIQEIMAEAKQCSSILNQMLVPS